MDPILIALVTLAIGIMTVLFFLSKKGMKKSLGLFYLWVH